MVNWRDKATKGKAISAFTDMTLSPISLDDVVYKIDFLVKERAEGIYQLSEKKDISYYDFALDFANKNGFNKDLVKKDSWRSILLEKPPKYTSLENV